MAWSAFDAISYFLYRAFKSTEYLSGLSATALENSLIKFVPEPRAVLMSSFSLSWNVNNNFITHWNIVSITVSVVVVLWLTVSTVCIINIALPCWKPTTLRSWRGKRRKRFFPTFLLIKRKLNLGYCVQWRSEANEKIVPPDRIE